jgi:TRAF3-interacting protein 1
MMLKEQIAAKPGKIVAGLEPENTNLMLQAVYRVAISGQNTDGAVKKILASADGASAPPE